MQLIVAPVPRLPLATACVVIDAGAVTDLAGRDGIARLTSDLLIEGTATDTGAQLAEKFERLGADVEITTDWDTCVVSLTALTEHFDQAVRLLGGVLQSPSFPEREVERLKTEQLAELLRVRSEPRELADDMFARVLYEKSSRFARPIGGVERSVTATSEADVRRFYHARFRAAGATVVMAGDISVDAGERLARAAFAAWSGDAPAAVSANDAPARKGRGLHLVSKPDAPQVELRVGHVGLPRKNPDYYSVVVMNAVLGGLFSSRINLNLREKHGYTYGAFSAFDWRRQKGPFAVSTAVQTEVAALAVKEVLSEIDRIRAAEVDADELSLATSYLNGVFPIRYETTESIAAALVALTTFSLPDDFHDAYRERMLAVTTADVLSAARRHLRPDDLQVVVVGDLEKLRGQMEPLGLGQPTSYDPADDREW